MLPGLMPKYADRSPGPGANDSGLRTGFPLWNPRVVERGTWGARQFRHATAVPFHDQQARSASL